MSQLSSKLRDTEDNGLVFWCPGCNSAHRIQHGTSHSWTWNGNVDKPTFSPSVLVRSGHYVPGKAHEGCWCTYNAEHPNQEPDFKCGICHSFVTDGRIQFLSDCTHELAGQTVSLPDWPT